MPPVTPRTMHGLFGLLDIDFRSAVIADQTTVDFVNRDGDGHILLVLGVDQRRYAFNQLTGTLGNLDDERVAAVRLFKKLQNASLGRI